MEISQGFIAPFLSDPKLFPVPAALVFLTYWLTRKQKIDELLFASRRDVYLEFIAFKGNVFFDWAEILKPDEGGDLLSKQKHHEKIASIFSRCRLFAGALLESKLRYYYELVMKNIRQNRKEPPEELYIIGLEIESLMRYDLAAISLGELVVIESILLFKRVKLWICS